MTPSKPPRLFSLRTSPEKVQTSPELIRKIKFIQKLSLPYSPCQGLVNLLVGSFEAPLTPIADMVLSKPKSSFINVNAPIALGLPPIFISINITGLQ
jgi:hypothetical protein